MQKILNLFSACLVFITLFIFSLSLLLTNPISSKSLIESIGEIYGYKIKVSFSRLHWNPITPNLQFNKISLQSTNVLEPITITLEEVNMDINLLTLFTLRPISNLSVNKGLVLLGRMPELTNVASLQKNYVLSKVLSFESLTVEGIKFKNFETKESLFEVKSLYLNRFRDEDYQFYLSIEDSKKDDLSLIIKPSDLSSKNGYLKGYLRSNKFKIPQSLFQSCYFCKSLGELRAELWMSILNGKLVSLDGKLKVGIDLLDLDHLETNVSLLNSVGPSFIFRDIIVSQHEAEFNIPDTSLLNSSDGFIFAISSLKLDNFIVKQGIRKFIPSLDKNLSFSGNISNLTFSLPSLATTKIGGKLDKVRIYLPNHETAIENLDGRFLFFQDKFLFRADSKFLTFKSSRLYTQPLEIYDFKADIMGLNHHSQFTWVNKNFSATVDSVPVKGSFSIYPQENMDSLEFSLAAYVNDSLYEEFSNLIPTLSWTKNIISWIDLHVNCGKIENVDLIYRGVLGKRIDKGTQSFQMGFDLEEACIEFDPLRLSKISLKGQIEDSSFLGKIVQSNLFGSNLISEINISKSNNSLSTFVVNLSGELSGPFDTFVSIYKGKTSTPFTEIFNDARVLGKHKTTFSSNFPLDKNELDVLGKNSFLSFQSRVYKGAIVISDNLSITDVSSSISFDNQTGFEKSFVNLRFNKVPLEFDVLTSIDTKQVNSTNISSKSTLSDRDLERIYPPILGKIKGKTDFLVNLKLPSFIQGFKEIRPQLSITSSLKNLEIIFPTPFYKPFDEESTFNLTSTLVSEGDMLQIDLNYKNFMRGKIFLGGEKPKGLITLGQKTYRGDIPSGKLLITGKVESVDPFEYANFSKNKNPLFKNNFLVIENLKIKNILIGQMELKNTSVDMERIGQAFQFYLTNEELKGSLFIPDILKKGVILDLDYLKLKKFNKESNMLFPSLLTQLKFPVVFSTADLEIDEQYFGNWKFILTSDMKSLTLDDIEGSYGEWKVGTIGDRKISQLQLRKKSSYWNSNLNTSIYSNSPNKGFKDLSIDVNFSSERVEVFPKISWKGLPQDFNFREFEGLLGFSIEEFLFEDIGEEQASSSAVLKLISFFNVPDTFEKFTNFDFSKVFKRGFYLDKAEGQLEVGKYKVAIDKPITLYSGSGKFKWTGFANKSDQGDFTDLDLEVIMTLPLRDYLPVSAFVLGGPLAAGIVYIAGKTFKKSLDKLSSGKWRIWGNIENPKTEFYGWFEDK